MTPPGTSRRSAVLAGYTGVVAVLGAVVFWRTEDPDLPHTSALNAVLDSRWLVASARLLVFVTVAYLLLSLGVRVRNGQWARSAGPVITDASAEELATNQGSIEDELRQARDIIKALTQRLDRSLRAREELLRYVADSSPPPEFRTTAQGVPGDRDDDQS